MYETYYVTAHKQPCRAASFSQNGKMISNRADVKNGNRKLIFSLFQCSDSANTYSGTLNKGIQIRCVRQKRSIKRDIELPVANHDVRTLAFSLLKLANPVAEELNSPFHTLGASVFSCAVSRCGQVLKRDPREKFFLAASPLVSSAFGRTLVGLWPTERSSPSHARRNL